jgi:hypothetical protein
MGADDVAERYRKFAKVHGSGVRILLKAHEKAVLLYLRQQWGFKSNNEAIRASIAAVAVMTRRGLQRLDLVIDPERED